MKYLAYNAVCLASIGGAVTLLILGIDHAWGWLLVLAFLSGIVPASKGGSA